MMDIDLTPGKTYESCFKWAKTYKVQGQITSLRTLSAKQEEGPRWFGLTVEDQVEVYVFAPSPRTAIKKLRRGKFDPCRTLWFLREGTPAPWTKNTKYYTPGQIESYQQTPQLIIPG
jgi:hypothetical protein